MMNYAKKCGWLSSMSGSQAERLNEITNPHLCWLVISAEVFSGKTPFIITETGASCHTSYSRK